MIEWNLPFKLISPNQQMHWSKKYRIDKKHRHAIIALWNTLKEKPITPCTITFTRIAPRQFDDDNLQMALKPIRDQIADLIIPTSSIAYRKKAGSSRKQKYIANMGKSDDDASLTWVYKQEKKPKTQILKITIEQRED